MVFFKVRDISVLFREDMNISLPQETFREIRALQVRCRQSRYMFLLKMARSLCLRRYAVLELLVKCLVTAYFHSSPCSDASARHGQHGFRHVQNQSSMVGANSGKFRSQIEYPATSENQLWISTAFPADSFVTPNVR